MEENYNSLLSLVQIYIRAKEETRKAFDEFNSFRQSLPEHTRKKIGVSPLCIQRQKMELKMKEEREAYEKMKGFQEK